MKQAPIDNSTLPEVPDPALPKGKGPVVPQPHNADSSPFLEGEEDPEQSAELERQQDA